MNIGYYLLIPTTLLQLVPYIPNMHYISKLQFWFNIQWILFVKH